MVRPDTSLKPMADLSNQLVHGSIEECIDNNKWIMDFKLRSLLMITREEVFFYIEYLHNRLNFQSNLS